MNLFKNGVGRPSNETIKRRKIFGFLIAAVVLLSVGFAALSVTLRINGTGRMEGRYSVHFENYDSNGVLAINTGYATSVAPIINQDKTELNNFEVVFNALEDAVEFKFKIVNDGNINAKIGTLTINDGTFTGDDATLTNLVQNNTVRTLKYVGGSKDGQALSVDDVIEAGEEQIVSLKYVLTPFEYGKISSSVTISGLEVVITYVQADKTAQAPIVNPIDEGGNNGSSNVQALSYPFSGTLSDGTTYTLTSDGKALIGGKSEINDFPMDEIIGDILVQNGIDNEDGETTDTIKPVFKGDKTYSAFYTEMESALNNAVSENEMTQEEADEYLTSQVAIFQNIVPITVLEFTDDVTNIYLSWNNSNLTSVIVSSTATVEGSIDNNIIQRR